MAKFWILFLTLAKKESKILKACYYITDDQGKLQGILASHVDDLNWAVTTPHENVMIEVGKLFIFGKSSERYFRFCGREVAQDDEV